MSEQTLVPPPAEIPVPALIEVQAAVRALLLTLDNVQAHTLFTSFIIAARAQIVSATSFVDAHYASVAAIEAAQQMGAQ